MPVKKISNIKNKKSKIAVKPKTTKIKKVTSKKLNAVVPVAKVARKMAIANARNIAKSAKKGALSVEVLDIGGKTIEEINLPEEIFGAKINKDLMSQAVRVYLANQRLGTAKTKDRGEVDRTTKKVWQQKGTGRARHGSRRAPIFVGGGVVFGPRPRDYSLNLSKKMKTAALFSALSSKLKNNEIKIISGLESITPKTKIMAGILNELGVLNKKILLVTPKEGENIEKVYRAARNIEGIKLLAANTLNTYAVLDNSLLLLMKNSIDAIKNNFVKEKK